LSSSGSNNNKKPPKKSRKAEKKTTVICNVSRMGSKLLTSQQKLYRKRWYLHSVLFERKLFYLVNTCSVLNKLKGQRKTKAPEGGVSMLVIS